MRHSMPLEKIAKRPLLLAVVATFAALCGPAPGLAGPLLGAAESFAVLGASTVTNAHVGSNPQTTIHGSVGVYAGSSITGFPPATVTGGAIHGPDSVSQQAQANETFAYLTLAALPFTSNLTGKILGVGLEATLMPGIYRFDDSAQLNGTLTLDALGDPNALFVFQIGSTLTTASDSSVIVANGGAGNGVYWQVGSSATLGSDTLFAGNILALASITLDPTAQILCGRALAQTAAVTLIDNQISNDCSVAAFGSGRQDFSSLGFSGGFESFPDANAPGGIGFRPIATGPGASAPEPSTMALFGLGLAGLGGLARRRQAHASRGITSNA